MDLDTKIRNRITKLDEEISNLQTRAPREIELYTARINERLTVLAEERAALQELLTEEPIE